MRRGNVVCDRNCSGLNRGSPTKIYDTEAGFFNYVTIRLFHCLVILKVDSMYITSQYSINHCSVCVLRYVFSILLQRVKALSQSIHCNDPLRKYLNTIIKVFSPELQSEFNR